MNPSELNYHVVSTFEQNESNRKYTMEEGKKYRQFLAGVIVSIASVAIGTCLGWTSPVGSKLNPRDADGNNLPLTDSPLSEHTTVDEDSWIASLVALGALIAPFIAGPLAEKFGRKWTLLGSSAFYIVSFIMFLTATNVPVMYIARLLQGFGVGFVMTVQPMYIGEIATDEVRGALGSFMQLFIVIGILYVYAIGPYVSYYVLQWCCLAIPILFVATFFFMPESPNYYISQGRKEDAVQALKYLRGKSAAGVQEELEQIQTTIEEAAKKQATIADVFRSKANFKALIISAGLVSFQQLSGINAVLFFSSAIFNAAGGGLDPNISTILVGIVMVIASGITPLVVDKLGRKIILMFSAGGMALSLAALGFYFINKDPKLGWLPVTSLIIFVAVYCVGFGPLPWAVMGEMFATEVKAPASSIVASTCWVLGFCVTRWFDTMQQAIGATWSFWTFGIFCCAAFAFTLLVVIETKGLSLKQIQDKLNGI